MPYRTYLTAPRGATPTSATRSASTEPREHYVPGLAAAHEPPLAPRGVVPVATAAIVVLLASGAAAVARTTADAAAQDPSLSIPGDTGASDEAELPEPGDR